MPRGTSKRIPQRRAEVSGSTKVIPNDALYSERCQPTILTYSVYNGGIKDLCVSLQLYIIPGPFLDWQCHLFETKQKELLLLLLLLLRWPLLLATGAHPCSGTQHQLRPKTLSRTLPQPHCTPAPQNQFPTAVSRPLPPPPPPPAACVSTGTTPCRPFCFGPALLRCRV